MRYLLLLLLPAAVLFANVQTVKIGVLAKRGAELTLKRWTPMAEYLSQEIPAYKFEIVPIPFNSLFKEVEQKNVDFMLANSGFYVVLERRYGAQRITTLVNKQVTGLTQKEFGGVIFTHIDN
ncbi:PhnD/SsuA/transferrin family substrate-binding protein, partial [Campylobacterota bacterium]